MPPLKGKHMSVIYITSAIDTHLVTEEDLERDFQVMQIQHPAWKESSFEQYIEYRKSLGTDRFVFDIYDVAFYTSKKDAEYDVILNHGDINECGSYPYASILRIGEGALYGKACTVESDVTLYEYNKNSNMYKLLTHKEHGYAPGRILARMNEAVRGVVSPVSERRTDSGRS